MITAFDYPKKQADFEAFIAANPDNHLLIDGAVMRVYTGADIPAKPVACCDDLQFRLALAQLGLLDAVKAHVASADAFVQAWWEKTRVFKADNPMLIEQATAMGVAGQLVAVIELAATMPSNA